MKTSSDLYYFNNPYEGYSKGHYFELGNTNDNGKAFHATLFHLPIEVHAAAIHVFKFYQYLIESTYQVPQESRIRQSAMESMDIALFSLNRVEYHLGNYSPLILGSKLLNPIPFAIVGKRDDENLYRNTFADLWDIIEQYNDRFNDKSIFRPTLLYHTKAGKDCLLGIADPPRTGNRYNPNKVVTAAVLFLYDLLRHVGPDCNIFYDLYTNDYRVTKEKIDLNTWRDASQFAFLPDIKQEISHTPPAAFYWEVSIVEVEEELAETCKKDEPINIEDYACLCIC